jgi:DNA-binding NtrC family response regulator
VKLLRVLQDGSFARIGGNTPLKADVRLVCATNRNLKAEVLANRFRMDLYFRLNVVNIQVPPLRERREDIPLLARSTVERLNRRHQQDKELSEPLVQHLRRQDWPGNVRELENTIEKLYVLSPGRQVVLDPTAIEPAPATPQRRESSGGGTPASVDDAIRALLGLPMDEVEKRMLLATLAHCGGNKSKAARQLQIGLKTLYRKLVSYGMIKDEKEEKDAEGAAS